MMHTHVRLPLVAKTIALLSTAVFAIAGNAALVNVQILGRSTDPRGQPDARPPAYHGPGVLGHEGDYWNGVPVDVYGKPFKARYPARMLLSDGKTQTGITLRFTGFYSADHWPGTDGAPVTNELMNSYVVCKASATIVVGGLAPNSLNDLCLFGNNSHAGAGAKFSVENAGLQITQGKEGPVFGQSVDYVLFKAVAADKDGQLKITVAPGESGLGIFNGLQLEGELPPSAAQRFDPARWNVKIWLRADDLARQGLKPGEPVGEWLDAARGIPFRPDPNPPCSDDIPTYEAVRLPDRSISVPAVRFGGAASLRQTEGFGVADNPMTAFVVYWPEEEPSGKWLQSVATRADALCLYDSGLDFGDAFGIHPTRRLYYTVYRQSGVRLGALEQLPAVLAGHQGEFNSGERFKGRIAEVLVFGKLFTAEDPERNIVEDYLRNKYFGGEDSPGGPGGIDVPWVKKEPARRAGSSGQEACDSLNEVTIFSLADQENPANTEYAAGEVTLSFSYTATVSTAPRPHNLDFPHEPNPDNSQVFVRIEDELWQFRNHWITGKGGATRYKGPDIDHMVRMEDAVYPPETGMGWFLGGMWYDTSERKLYAPVHVEQEGPFRNHPVAPWPARKIALATSTDKGRTWKYEGDIITPDTYFYTLDAYKFSGSGYSNGHSDFGFYADIRGGYFYIFPEESWYYKGQWGALWNVRVARCAISDKMAPGKWRFFYNGAWDEPGLSGKSTTIAPSHMWGVIYSEQLGKYVCLMNANQDPAVPPHLDGVCIGVCSDLGRQDWTWGFCPEAMFGFMNLLNAEGTDVTTCGNAFRHYAYFAENSFRRTDFTLEKGQTTALAWPPRFMFEAHPESSDPVQRRRTKFIGASNPDVSYSGDWTNRAQAGSFESKVTEATAPGCSLELKFKGPEIYWRALRSPTSGKADVYLDGELRRTVDCFSPISTVTGQFVYLKGGLDPDRMHTIKIVVKGEKNSKSGGVAIGHIAFEYGAESYRASAGFSSILGKNNWYYLGREDAAERSLRFTPSNEVFVKEWVGQGNCRLGNNYQLVDGPEECIRRWIAPHAGRVRVEGEIRGEETNNTSVIVRLTHNQREIWNPRLSPTGQTANHDLTLDVEQGDALNFVVSQSPESKAGTKKLFWDPVITYLSSSPAVWKSNPPSNENIAFGKYARPKMLACMDQPFAAVDADLTTTFTIYADDKLSMGEDWLQLDLEKPFTIDHYVVISKPPDPKWKPDTFALQRSDDGLHWIEVDSVAHAAGERVERAVPPFIARFVRLWLPKGKPFSITEFELYHVGTKGLHEE